MQHQVFNLTKSAYCEICWEHLLTLKKLFSYILFLVLVLSSGKTRQDKTRIY